MPDRYGILIQQSQLVVVGDDQAGNTGFGGYDLGGQNTCFGPHPFFAETIPMMWLKNYDRQDTS
jgi:hypothetical protein